MKSKRDSSNYKNKNRAKNTSENQEIENHFST
jgi:hypothetical protein